MRRGVPHGVPSPIIQVFLKLKYVGVSQVTEGLCTRIYRNYPLCTYSAMYSRRLVAPNCKIPLFTPFYPLIPTLCAIKYSHSIFLSIKTFFVTPFEYLCRFFSPWLQDHLTLLPVRHGVDEQQRLHVQGSLHVDVLPLLLPMPLPDMLPGVLGRGVAVAVL